jgi:NAD/NADP transhydrogenase alpha subunit
VLASLAVDATVSNASLPLTLGILVGIATAGGFVAAWLGRPRHTLHAALTGGSFALFVFGMVVRLSRPSLYELLSVLDALAGFVAVLVGASVCGGWLARALTRPPSGMRGGKRKR